MEKTFEEIKNELGFIEFEETRKKYMEIYYLHKFSNNYTNSKLETNPNERLVDSEKIISDFKKHAYYDSFEEIDGWITNKWIAEPYFENDIKIKYAALDHDRLDRMQQQLENNIVKFVTNEIKSGKSLCDTHAIALVSDLDSITYFKINNEMRMKISGLADSVSELEKFSKQSENHGIFNYGLFGSSPKQMIEESFLNNNSYNSLSNEIKEWLSNEFNSLSHSERLHYLSVTASTNRTEISDFAVKKISEPDFFRKNEINVSPELRNSFYYYDGILMNISVMANSSWSKNDIEKSTFILNSLIKIGLLDQDMQKNQFNDALLKFEKNMNDKNLSYLLPLFRQEFEESTKLREDYILNNCSAICARIIKNPDTLNDFDQSYLKKLNNYFINSPSFSEEQKKLLQKDPINFLTSTIINSKNNRQEIINNEIDKIIETAKNNQNGTIKRRLGF